LRALGLEAVLASAAMIHFLQRVVDSGSHTYDAQIVEDLTDLTIVHFSAVYAIRHRTGPYAAPGAATGARAVTQASSDDDV
jgi:hypothetical protein